MSTIVLQARPSDNGQITLTLADPVGSVTDGQLVEIDVGGDEPSTIVLHGQTQFEVPTSAVAVLFADGTVWKA